MKGTPKELPYIIHNHITGRGRGTARGRGRGAAAQGRNTVSTRRGAKYAVPNKLRKFPGAQTNTVSNCQTT